MHNPLSRHTNCIINQKKIKLKYRGINITLFKIQNHVPIHLITERDILRTKITNNLLKFAL